MKISDIQKKVVSESTALLIRPRKDSWKPGDPREYDVKPMFTGNHRGWVILDLTTARAMDTVYEALRKTVDAEGLLKWDRLPVTKLIDFTWKYIQ